jgi:hypothetical protein
VSVRVDMLNPLNKESQREGRHHLRSRHNELTDSAEPEVKFEDLVEWAPIGGEVGCEPILVFEKRREDSAGAYPSALRLTLSRYHCVRGGAGIRSIP